MAAAGSDHSDNYGWDQALDADVQALLDAAAATETTTAAATAATTTTANAPSQDVHLLARSAAGALDPDYAADALPALVSHVDYPDLSQLLSDISTDPLSSEQQHPSKAFPSPDAASPLARFRTAPRKPFSVSDLTAGAWCELQYEYTLTRLPGGRRTRTPAMRAGTRVHARLEEQVHTTVRVEVTTREDGFGLRLWNLVHGLRTLRETGLTRELEIWGVVNDDHDHDHDGNRDGDDAPDDEPQVVNGVIDALSYQNPDPSSLPGTATDEQHASPATPKKKRKQKQKTPTPQSTRITDFFPSSPPNGSASIPLASPSLSSSPPVTSATRKIYITDVKTRGSTRLPSGAAVRPTEMQLFLYHRFLVDLATGRLDFYRVFARYGLDPDAPFSDAYVAQIAELHDEIFDDDGAATSDEVTSTAAGPSKEMTGTNMAAAGGGPIASSGSIPLEKADHNIRYNTLRSLLRLVRAEVALTFPHGADSIGDLVSVEYRLRPRSPPKKQWQQYAQEQRRQRRQEQATTTPEPSRMRGSNSSAEEVETEEQEDTDADSDADGATASRCIGTKVLVVDRARLDSYLAHYLTWWRGERPATGVTELEEASLKCGSCEFAADCSWRQALDDARVQRVRASMQAGRRPKT